TRHVVIPSESMIKEYMVAIGQIKKVCSITEPVSLQTLLTLPNIFQIEEDVLTGSAEEKILDAVQLLAHDLIKTRKTEGLTLSKDVAVHMQAMIKKLQKVEKLSIQLRKDKKKQLDVLITQLEPVSVDQRSVQQCMMENQKIALLSELEKIDISEEISRAGMHAKTVLKLIKTSESQGKKLDFMVQELNREINTMASKCSNAQISSLAIDMKTDIEKAREQVQNIL
ncbi:DUF1732 domain-containing protein, partial [Candidatus Babeliales bacterium]|nr:DUF1732 domain-containing protein [Candidatus Babeliales bacterium]